MINSKQFGAKVNGEHAAKYARSSHWDGSKFVNLESTTMNINWQTLPKLLYKQFCEREGREPKTSIPVIPFNNDQFVEASDGMKFVWFGHSALLIRLAGLTLLIDPMLGENASPVAPFATKRFSKGTLDLIDQFPEIDLVLLTHDHYDHLDLDSIQRLKSKVNHFFVALGVARHLERWGIPFRQITEFDWWQSSQFNDIDITFTPTRHFSGRGLSDRAKSLWGGWVFQTGSESIWFSGDGGYGKHFKEIGQRLGPFDFGFMECGQYNRHWHQIHMFPEESVRAALDAQASKIMAVHWGGFALAQHRWKDPIERFVSEAIKQGVNFLHPAIGELCTITDTVGSKWWEESD